MPVKHGGASDKGGDLRFGLLCSVALHLVAIVIAVFGLPQLLAPPPEISEPMVVEIAELGDKTNPPPKQVQAPKPVDQPAEPPKQEAPPTPEPPKPAPPKPEPPKPPEPTPEPPKPEPPKPEPPMPVPPPKPAEPEPVPVPTPKPKPPEPKPPEPKPEPDVLKDIKPPAKKPPEPKPQTSADFDNLLKSVDKLRDAAKPAPAPQPQQQTGGSNKTVNSNSNIPSEPVSITDKEYIAAQFRKCWNFDPGVRDAANLIVRVHVLLNPDGSVVRADIVDDPRYYSDSFFRSAADSARRAVYTCSSIKLPPGKYDALKDLVLNFDPRDSLR